MTLVGVRQATFSWAPSTGSVSGYIVLASRNGGPETTLGFTTQPQYTVDAAFGDSIVLRVRAYGTSGSAQTPTVSDPSPPSPTISFVAAPAWQSSDVLVLHCASCAKARLVALGSPQTPYDFPVMASPWKPIGLGWNLAGPGAQMAFRNELSGQLAVTRIGPDGALPIATSGLSWMSVRQPLGLADPDGDGVDSILLRNQATGRVERWGPSGSQLVQQATLDVPASWRFVQAYDTDGDGADELFWQGDAPNDLRISRGADGGFVASDERFQLALAGEPVRVADFDGNGEADVLFRDGAGTLGIAYFDAAGLDREVTLGLPLLTAFFLLPPRTSARIDGQPGEEVVVQHASSKAVYMARPLVAPASMLTKLFDVEAAWEPIGRLN